MALIPANILFPSPKYSVGGIVFDLLIQESHSLRNIITTHTIEDGSAIADHIRNELRQGALVGIVTNYSIGLNFTEGLTLPGKASRYKDAYDAMVALWRERSLVTIVTQLEVYENVAISSVDVSRAPETGEALQFQVSFQQVKSVSLKEVEVTAGIRVGDMGADLNRQAAPALDNGRQIGTQFAGQSIDLQLLLGGI